MLFESGEPRERMDSQRIIDWIQITTGVAIVLGLALVGVELTQSRDVAEAQLSSDGLNQALPKSDGVDR